jgi:pyridoxamine 5'-phosphate oxidase
MDDLTESNVTPDPIKQFRTWFDAAAHLPQPDAMTLATASPAGRPSARMVLLKGVDDRGFTFFTNYESRKGGELAQNSQAALVFFWQELHRQVRVEGVVERVTAGESDVYFATRARGSQIAARASAQSRQLSGREELERRVGAVEAEFEGQPVRRPDFWGGYRLIPEVVEFWQGRPNRLHDRLRYTRRGDVWEIERLAP